MSYMKSGNTMLMVGKVSRDATLRETRTGKHVAGFSMRYARQHNVDGQMENKYMEVTVWNDDALLIGDENIGIGKGDTVLVVGQLVEDTYRREGEDPNEPKYKVDADIVLDMTSIFQVAQMVVLGGEEPQDDGDDSPDASKIEDTFEGTPFDDDDDELPL